MYSLYVSHSYVLGTNNQLQVGVQYTLECVGTGYYLGVGEYGPIFSKGKPQGNNNFYWEIIDTQNAYALKNIGNNSHLACTYNGSLRVVFSSQAPKYSGLEWLFTPGGNNNIVAIENQCIKHHYLYKSSNQLLLTNNTEQRYLWWRFTPVQNNIQRKRRETTNNQLEFLISKVNGLEAQIIDMEKRLIKMYNRDQKELIKRYNIEQQELVDTYRSNQHQMISIYESNQKQIENKIGHVNKRVDDLENSNLIKVESHTFNTNTTKNIERGLEVGKMLNFVLRFMGFFFYYLWIFMGFFQKLPIF